MTEYLMLTGSTRSLVRDGRGVSWTDATGIENDWGSRASASGPSFGPPSVPKCPKGEAPEAPPLCLRRVSAALAARPVTPTLRVR
jgi:hypothetical protein